MIYLVPAKVIFNGFTGIPGHCGQSQLLNIKLLKSHVFLNVHRNQWNEKKIQTDYLPLAINNKKSLALPVYEAAQSGNSSNTSGFYPGSEGSTHRYLETWRADSNSSSHAPGPTQGPGVRPSEFPAPYRSKTSVSDPYSLDPDPDPAF
jgi:hypothetical protein